MLGRCCFLPSREKVMIVEDGCLVGCDMMVAFSVPLDGPMDWLISSNTLHTVVLLYSTVIP